MKTLQKTKSYLSPFIIFFLAITGIGVWFLLNIDTLIKHKSKDSLINIDSYKQK